MCRQYDWAKAQATAMRLHRAQGPHWLWCAITLLAMQAMDGSQASQGAALHFILAKL